MRKFLRRYGRYLIVLAILVAVPVFVVFGDEIGNFLSGTAGGQPADKGKTDEPDKGKGQDTPEPTQEKPAPPQDTQAPEPTATQAQIAEATATEGQPGGGPGASGQWDKSSLVFRGGCLGSCSQAQA